MKKIMMTLVLVLGAYLWTTAETVDEFMVAMKNDPAVECVELTPDMFLTMLNQQGVAADANAIKNLEKVSCIQVLNGTFPGDPAPLKARLAALTVDNLDEMVNTSDDGELTRVWMQTDGNRCKMILLVNADEREHDWQVVKLHCDIALDENFNLNRLLQFN